MSTPIPKNRRALDSSEIITRKCKSEYKNSQIELVEHGRGILVERALYGKLYRSEKGRQQRPDVESRSLGSVSISESDYPKFRKTAPLRRHRAHQVAPDENGQ